MAPLPAELFSANADFHGDLLRNIPGIRDSQDLFDDLTDDPADHAVDLRGQEGRHAALVDWHSYAFTHRVGDYLHDQAANGLLVQSARCRGPNAAVFRPERLSNVRDRAYLTCRLDLARNRLVVERTRGRAWMRITPGQAG